MDFNPTAESAPNTGIMAVISDLPRDGFILDAAQPSTITQLKQAKKSQQVELGTYLESNQGLGAGAEYQGRLARVREDVGLESTSSEPTFRDKFVWKAGEVVDLNEVSGAMNVNEELQITDYKGRRYHLVKTSDGFSMLEAYDESDKPLKTRGKSLEGRTVTIGRFKSESDRRLEQAGFNNNEPIVRLVDPGVTITQTKFGEEYVEEREGRKMQVVASRMQISFPDTNEGWGVLVSSIKLVPHDQEELQRLAAAQWRIRDSATRIREFVQNRPNQTEPLTVGATQIHSFQFDAEGGIAFVTEEGPDDNRIRTEYSFLPFVGSTKKEFVKAGNNWVAPAVPDQELDGSRKLTPLQAAKTLDQFRYRLP